MCSPTTTRADEQSDKDKDPHSMTLKELRAELKQLGAVCKACTEKSDFADRLRQARTEVKSPKNARIAGSMSPGCVAKSSCKQGCDLCAAASSQSKTVCRAISFCEWKQADSQRQRSEGAAGTSTTSTTNKANPTRKTPAGARTPGHSSSSKGWSSGKEGKSKSKSSPRSSKSSTLAGGGGGGGGEGGAAMALFAKASAGDVVAVRAAVEQGLSVLVTDDRGATALHYACWYGHLDTVEVLVRAGALIDAVSGDGFTPLHLAAAFGHSVVVASLLASGADGARRDRDGNTPIQLAQRGNFQGTVHILAGHLKQDVAVAGRARQGGGGRSSSAHAQQQQQQACTTRYARLGLCSPDSHTQALLQVEEEEVARRAAERRGWQEEGEAEEEEAEGQRHEAFRREQQAQADEQQVPTASPRQPHHKKDRGEARTSRLVGHPAGVSGSKGLRVRKSAARLVYLRDNGWDDLSDGADGTILSLLGDGRECIVRWDNGNENEYAIGFGGLYDLQVA